MVRLMNAAPFFSLWFRAYANKIQRTFLRGSRKVRHWEIPVSGNFALKKRKATV